MEELLWSLLNTAGISFFLYILIGLLVMGKKILEGKLKYLSMAILVFGVIQLFSAGESDDLNAPLKIANNFDAEDASLVTKGSTQDNLSLDFDLLVTYLVQDDKLIPVEATANISGFVLGYDYDFIGIDTGVKEKGEKTNFTASGILHWKLFGQKIYSQFKEFKGEI